MEPSRVELPRVDRRGFFRMAGLSVAATAVLAACREHGAKKQVPISGSSPTYKAPATKALTDTVLLRTASSLQMSIVDAYQKLFDNGFINDAAVLALLQVFQAQHRAHAQTFVDLTTSAGGTPCANLNTKITGDLFQPLLNTIGAAGDNKFDDAKAFAHALETLAAASCQSFVEALSQPALRQATMSVGCVEARHAAVLAATLNDETYLGSGAAAVATAPATAPTTTVPTALQTTIAGTTTTTTPPPVEDNKFYAIPSTFGSLGLIPLTVGASTAGVSRKAVNLETPSLNSYLYDDEAC